MIFIIGTNNDSESEGKNETPSVPGRRDLPEPPDIRKVQRLRERVKADRAAGLTGKGMNFGRLNPTAGKRIRDAGFYTLIPMVMVAGPLLGYFVGRLWEAKFGGEPWPVTVGTLIGLVAGFRQVYLMLLDRTKPPTPPD